MELEREELETVYAVLHELINAMPYREVNTYLGSLTIKRMDALYQKIGYELYGDGNNEWE